MTVTLVDQDGLVELDSRDGDGISVTLLWLRGTSLLILVVDDQRTGSSFELEVHPDLALDAFRHPFAYSALRQAQPFTTSADAPAEDAPGRSRTRSRTSPTPWRAIR